MAKKYELDVEIKADSTLKDVEDSLLKILQLKEQIKGEMKATSDSDIKGIVELTKAQGELIKTTKELEAAVKVKKKEEEKSQQATKKGKELTEDEIKEKLQLQQVTNEQKRALSLLIKEERAAEGSREKAIAQNQRLRAERDKLNITTEEGRKSLIRINDEIDKNNEFLIDNVDALGKQKYNVGNYTESVKEAIEASGLFGGIIGRLTAIQGTAISILAKLRGEEAAETKAKAVNTAQTTKLTVAQKALNTAQLTGVKAAKTLKVALAATGIGLLFAGIGSLVALFTKTQGGINSASIAMAKMGAIVSVLIGRIASFGSGLIGLAKAAKQALSGDFSEAAETASKAVDKMGAAFNGFGKEVEEAMANAERIERMEIALRSLRRELELSIARTSAFEEQQRAIADDATRSFKERESAAENARNASLKRTSQQIALAKEELNIINERVELERSAGTLTDDLLDQQLEAQKKVIESEKESLLIRVENEKQRNELIQDRLEKDLDILIDGFDNQKTINERLIADDKRTFAIRQSILDDTRKLSDDSFEKQIETIQKFTGKQVDANDLIATSDAIALNEKIRSLGLSEIIEGRLLEVIRDRRTAVQDLNDSEKELNQARLDSARNILQSVQTIEQDIFDLKVEQLEAEAVMTEDIINKIKSEREKQLIDQAEFDKEAARQTITDEEEKAAKIKEINDKLNNDLLRLNLSTEQKLAQARQEQLNELIDNATRLTDAISEQLSKKSQEDISRIDKQLDAQAQNIEVQRQRAQAGEQNTLEFEQRKQKELEAEREAAAKKEARRQKVLSYFSLLSGYAKSDAKTALTNTARDIAISEAVTLAFKEKGGLVGKATETTTLNGSMLSKSHGGGNDVLAVLDKREGILTANQMGKIGGEAGLNNLAKLIDSGIFNDALMMPKVPVFSSPRSRGNDAALLSEIVRLQDIVRNKKETSVTVDNYGNVIKREVENGYTQTIKKIRERPRF